MKGMDWPLARQKMANEKVVYQCSVPNGAMNAAFQLCDFLLIRAREQEGEIPSWCLLHTQFTLRDDHSGHPSLKFWKFDVVTCPSTEMREGVWYEDGLELEPMRYYIERKATEKRPLSIYSVMIERTRRYLVTRDGEWLYEYKMSEAERVLPPKFYHVVHGKDLASQWHYKMACHPVVGPPLPIAVPLAPPVSHTPKIPFPVHIFRAFAKGAIDAKEECPILMEPLTQENVSCGPCGHLCCYEALVQAVETSGKCPVCRAAIKIEEIQTYN